MDHSGSHTSSCVTSGRDWFSINDGRELMLFQLTRPGNRSYSSGTYVDTRGTAHHLTAQEFSLEPALLGERKDERYPVSWRIRVPSLALSLQCSAMLDSQELTGGNNYWEGAVSIPDRPAGSGIWR
jgi:predicted secreted hydrolase